MDCMMVMMMMMMIKKDAEEMNEEESKRRRTPGEGREEEWLVMTPADDDGEPAVAADAPSPTRHARAPWRPRPSPHRIRGSLLIPHPSIA